MARRRRRIEHDNPDRWMISYADFITLLFAVFVVLYAISSVNEAKYRIFGNSVNIALSEHTTQLPPSIVPTTDKTEPKQKALIVDKRTAQLGEQQRKIQDRMKAIADGLSEIMAPMIERGQVSVNQTKRGVVIDISASSLFMTGEAALQPEAAVILDRVATVLSKEDQPIEVEGHTDNVPINTPLFPSNWELSSARASSVVRMLIEHGIPEQRLSAVGLASNQPVEPNDTPENRAKNRRVSITILSPNTEHDPMAPNP